MVDLAWIQQTWSHTCGTVAVTWSSLTYSDKPRAGVGGVMWSCWVGGRLVGREGPQSHYWRVRMVSRPSSTPRHHILHPESPPTLGRGGAVEHHDLSGERGEVRGERTKAHMTTVRERLTAEYNGGR